MRVPLVLGLLLAVGGVAVAAWLAFSGPGDGIPDTPPEWTDEGGGGAVAKTPGHEVVAGTLEDEFGDPVEGAHVYLLERGDPIIPVEEPRIARSGEDGRFELEKREEEVVDLIAFRPGFRPALVESVTRGAEHRVVLPSGGRIRGRVEDDLGRPVVGARVTARTAGTKLDPPKGRFFPRHATFDLSFARTMSLLGGDFVLRGIGEGGVELFVTKRGYPGSAVPGRVFAAGGPAVTLVLLRPFRAEVRVKDEVSGEPIIAAGMKIELVGSEHEPVEGATGLDGVFRESFAFPAVDPPEATARVTAWLEEYGESVADGVPLDRIAEGKGFTLALTKRAPAKLRIRLLYDTGEPYGRWVYFELTKWSKTVIHRWGRVDEKGWMEFQAPPGTYDSIRPLARGGPRADSLENIELKSGQELERTLTITRGSDLRVKLSSADGRERFRGRIRIQIGDYSRESGLWGRSAFFPDLPAGRAVVTVTAKDHVPVTKKVVLAKGAALTLPISLEMP